MPRHIVSAEDIFVTPGEVAPITLTYRTNPEEENANTFNFSVAIDSSDLNVEDTNPDLTGIQLPEGTFIDAFEFGDTDPAEGFQSISADNDENDIDNDPSTDVLVTLAYARPFDGDWPFAAEGVDGQPVTLGTLEFTTLDDFTGTRANIILRDPDSDFIQADVAPEDQLGLFNIPDERLDAVNIKAENGIPNHAIDAELDSAFEPSSNVDISLTYSSQDPVRANANTFNFDVAINSSVFTVEDTNPDLTGIQLPEGTFITDFVFGDTDPADGFQSISANFDTEDVDNDPRTDVIITLAYARPFDGDWPFAAEGVTEDQTSVDLGSLRLPLSGDFNPETQATTVNVVLRDPDSDFEGSQGDVLDQLVLPLDNIAPVFDQEAFTFEIAENTAVDTVVGTVTATDEDEGDTLSFSITGNVDPDGDGTNAFAINAETGEITVTDSDDLDFETNPSLELTVEVSDGTATDTATVTVDLTNVDETSPVFDGAPFTFDVDENSSVDTVVGTVVANDVEPDVNPLSFSITANVDPDGDGTNAFAINAETGEITVADSGDLDFEQNESFEVTVEVSDGTNTSGTGITININDVVENQPPQIQTLGEQNIDENNTAVVTVEANDPDGDNLSFSLSGGADQGLFAIDADGNLSFSEAPDFENPQDADEDNVYEVDVTVSDGNAQTEDVTQSFQVTVNDVNEAPVAEDDTATTDEDSVLEVGITPRQVVSAELLNDAVADDEANIALRYSTANPPRANAQVFNFEVAVDSSQFILEDTNTDLDRIQLSEDTFLEGFEFGSLFAESGVPSASADTEDIDNDPTTDTVITFAYLRLEEDWPFGSPDVPAEQEFVDLGTLSLPVSDAFNETTANVVLREPDSNFEGNPGDLITTIAIPSGETDPALASNLLANDSDPDEGDTLTISAVNAVNGDEIDEINVGTEFELASGALLTVNDDGSYIFDPNGAFESLPVGQSEDITFTYTVSDAEGLTDEATATITVEGRNDSPEFVAPDPFEFTVDEFVGTPTNGGNGASDAPVQIEVNLLANENGTPGAELTPADIANGDSFFVEILASADDPSGISSLSLELGFDPAVLSALEEQFNDATNIIVDRFDFGPGRVAELENGTITLAGGTIDANTDDDGDGIPDNVIGANGNLEQFALLQFDAIADPTDTVIDLEFPGVDDNGNPLGGSLGDGTSLSDVERNVQDFTFTDTEEGDGTFVGTVQAEDPDEGDTVSFSLTGNVDDDLFTIDAETGELSFNEVPDFENPQDADQNNVYILEVTATDSEGEAVSDTLEVIVENVNEVPVAADDTGRTDEDTVLVEVADGVLANDTDPDGDDLAVSAVNGDEANVDTEITLDSGALLTLNADGSYEYDPNGVFDELNDGETATDTFTYTVADGNGGTDTAEVTITIDGITDNVAPNFVDTEIAVDENTTDVPVEVEDADGDEVTLSLAGGADEGLFTIDADGNLNFDDAPDFENPQDADGDNVYEVEVTADDGNGGTTTEALEITVGNVNEAPVITSDDEAEVQENLTFVTTVTAEDPENDAISFALAGGDDRSLFDIDPNTGDLRFINAPDFENPLDADGNNVYEVEVTADDGNGGTTTEALEITVTDQQISGDGNVVNIDPSEPLIHTLTGNSDGLVEVGLVLLDDSGETTASALQRGADVRTVFSVFPDEFANGEPGTFEDLGTIQRILSVVGANRVGYVLNEGNEQTIDEILAQNANNLAETLEFGNFNQSQQGNTLTLEAGGVTFEVSQTGEESPLGANLQAEQGLEVFDLRAETEEVTAELTFDLISVAAFDNAIGFYTVNQEDGTIELQDEEGNVTQFTPGEVSTRDYINALLENVITNENDDGEEEDIILKGGANVDETSAGFNFDLDGGQIVVPFIIARGGNLDALPDSADELPLRSEIYTPFIGANSDGADHFRLLADNTFGIEDLRGGGDQDFNDIIFQFEFNAA